MPPPPLLGARVRLRAPRPGDIADRLAAGRDPEFRRMVGARPAVAPLTRSDAERWFAALVREPYGWVIEHGGRVRRRGVAVSILVVLVRRIRATP
jgi:hypothetical protein